MSWQPGVARNYPTEENCTSVHVCVCVWSHGGKKKPNSAHACVTISCQLINDLWVQISAELTCHIPTLVGSPFSNVNSVTENASYLVRASDLRIAWPRPHPVSPGVTRLLSLLPAAVLEVMIVVIFFSTVLGRKKSLNLAEDVRCPKSYLNPRLSRMGTSASVPIGASVSHYNECNIVFFFRAVTFLSEYYLTSHLHPINNA